MISVIMPSLRPDAALCRVREFEATNKDTDYEITIVSPFKIDGEKVNWVYEEKASGLTHAHNVAYQSSTGEYVVWWADDCSPTPNCLAKMLNFVESQTGLFIGAYKLNDGYWLEPPLYAVYAKLYANFGCASRKTIEGIGGYLDTIYKGFWADVDMSLRTWEAGGRVEVCPNTWVDLTNSQEEISQENKEENFDNDLETFLKRWHHKLGNGVDISAVRKNFYIINRPLELWR